MPTLQGGHRQPGQGLPVGVKKQIRQKTRRKGWMMEQEGQSMELVFYPWPGHKPLEQEGDPCPVQRRLWECPFGAEKDCSWNSVLLGRNFWAQLPVR